MSREILDRMPHKGPMRLIETIEQASDARLTCLCKEHRRPDYPLRLGASLMTASLAELGAQAAAAHASITEIEGAHRGMVLSYKDLNILLPEPPQTGRLRVTAHKQSHMGQMAVYTFEVREDDIPVLTGEVLLIIEKAQT